VRSSNQGQNLRYSAKWLVHVRLKPVHIHISSMRHWSLSRVSRLLAGRAGQFGGRNTLPGILSFVSTEERQAFFSITQLGTQPRRASVTSPLDNADADPRDNGDRPSQSILERREYQSSAGGSYRSGGNPPGGSGSGSIFAITSSPLLYAALTTIMGLGMGR